MVAGKGLEPLTLAGVASKTTAYTNSATQPFQITRTVIYRHLRKRQDVKSGLLAFVMVVSGHQKA